MNKRIRKKQKAVARRQSKKRIRKLMQKKGKMNNGTLIANYVHYITYGEDITGMSAYGPKAMINAVSESMRRVAYALGSTLQHYAKVMQEAINKANEKLISIDASKLLLQLRDQEEEQDDGVHESDAR